MYRYRSHKTYGHDIGLSACFRQWRADSHCRFLHGYALSVHLEFEADTLDTRNWVMDFGNLKPVKSWLESQFDHKTVVAADDPDLFRFKHLADAEMIQLVVLENVGCEAFAEHVARFVEPWVERESNGRVRLVEVRIKEHGANGASVICSLPG